MINCPNCGATIDVNVNKCAYCGTSYFDISCLQISGKLFYLKVKATDSKGKGIVVTAKVICMPNFTVTFTEDTVDLVETGFTFAYKKSATMGLELRCLEENGEFMKVERQEE